MPFQFRLQKVLNIRQRLLEIQTREVARASRVVEAIDRQLVDLAKEIQQHNTGVQQLSHPLNVAHLMGRGQWVNHLQERQETMTAERAEAVELREQERQKLTQAWRDLEILNKLREKQKAAWEEEQRKLERQELDELGQIMADREQREKNALEEARNT